MILQVPGLVLLLMGVSPVSFAGVSHPGAGADATCMKNAAASLAALAHGDFKAVGKDFAPETARALPPPKVERAWARVREAFGAYRSRGQPRRQMLHGDAVVVAPLRFARGALYFVAGCDAASRIKSFLLLLPSAVEAPPPIEAHTESSGVRVQPLAVPSPYGPLRGALTLPAGQGPFPAVVMVHGSGPNDLDETIGGAKPFRDLADGLAKRGVASLRYDKRTFAHAMQMVGKAVTVDDVSTDDALTALHMLAKQPAIDAKHVFVLGHSLGAQMAPRIAVRDPRLAGVIMLAAPARPLLDVIAEQDREMGARQGMTPAQIAAAEKAVATERALLANADPMHPPEGSYGSFPQSFLLSLHDYDQVAVAEKLTLPMLILQGASDFQVSPKNDFDAWKKALAGKSNVTFHSYPGLSHLFTPAGKTLTEADYAKPAHVDPEVIRDIANWIKAQPER